jgi:hypothetical protein
MKTNPSYERRLCLWETNYGRECGWQIERNGAIIATLSDPRYEDMFWESYRMEVTTDDPILRDRLHTKKFWAQAETEKVRWRNLKFLELAEFAFPGMSPFPEPGRLIMRGLYLPIDPPKLYDKIILAIRRWTRNQATNKTMHASCGSRVS